MDIIWIRDIIIKCNINSNGPPFGANGGNFMKTKIPEPNKMRRIKGPKLSAKEFQTAKIKITTYLDEDVLLALKQKADETRSKYQTLLNQILRNSLVDKKSNLFTRLERLEKAVFESKASV
jgi:predicted DNA binding CopG/RHH family protein